MKKAKDLGLQYMLELNMKPAKTMGQLYAAIVESCNRETADAFADYFETRADEERRGKTDDQSDFYSFKNIDINLLLKGGN